MVVGIPTSCCFSSDQVPCRVFDLRRNIVREYSEELLGIPEHDGIRIKPIGYNAWPLYRIASERAGRRVRDRQYGPLGEHQPRPPPGARDVGSARL
jgi:hypothetical protein